MNTLDTWTPLFKSIIASSIWEQPYHVRVVWITMIAYKDKHGFVEASLPGLKRLSGVTMPECREAVAIMEAPDPDSKCTDDKGIKIKKVEGGWMVLGHERFQKKMNQVSTQVNNAKRQKEFRERKKKEKNEGKPLPGELEHEAALNAGASEAQLDGIITKNL